MTYHLLNATFLSVVVVVVLVAERHRRRRGHRHPARATAVTMLVLLALTAVFDNVLVGLEIVAYDPRRTSGVLLGVAPVEDFAYTIAAVLLLPAVWELAPRRRSSRRDDDRDDDGDDEGRPATPAPRPAADPTGSRGTEGRGRRPSGRHRLP